MKMTFRWYGEDDPVSLEAIRQIQGVSGIVSAVYDVPVGEVWPREKIARIRDLAAEAGLGAEVVESIPVHEDVKLGLPTREKYADTFGENLLRAGEAGVKCVCYNFMPVLDWVRTDLAYRHADGSTSLAFDGAEIARSDPADLHLPGWDESYAPGEMRALIARYEGTPREALFERLVWFLERVLPAAEEAGVKLAIHPDDPPRSLFGLPRTMGREEDFERLFAALPSAANGMTFCTGSLGAGKFNDLPKMAEKFAGRTYFAHIRQLKFTGEDRFYENGHMTALGDVDVYAVVRALVRGGFDGYVRPDHGRNIWGEDGRPGYGLYDRALGAAYLSGLFEAIEKEEKERG